MWEDNGERDGVEKYGDGGAIYRKGDGGKIMGREMVIRYIGRVVRYIGRVMVGR